MARYPLKNERQEMLNYMRIYMYVIYVCDGTFKHPKRSKQLVEVRQMPYEVNES